MSYCRIAATTTITVHDFRALTDAWNRFGSTGLVGRFICLKPLTEAQQRRLPAGLLALL
jgi:hypothetical protein